MYGTSLKEILIHSAKFLKGLSYDIMQTSPSGPRAPAEKKVALPALPPDHNRRRAAGKVLPGMS
jgi:hypothetical protein